MTYEITLEDELEIVELYKTHTLREVAAKVRRGRLLVAKILRMHGVELRPACPSPKSLYRGVHLDRERGIWRARIYVDGKRVDLGRFTTEERAVRAVRRARKDGE